MVARSAGQVKGEDRMRSWGGLLLAVVLGSPAGSEQPAMIEVRQIAPDRHMLAVEVFSVEQAQNLQAALTRRAAALCGAKPFWFGKYAFQANKKITGKPEPAQPMTFLQEIGCGETPRAQSKQSGPAFDAAAGDDKAVIAATQKWFDQVEGADLAAAYRALGSQVGASPFDDWKSDALAAAKKAGKGLSHNIYKVTWYRDPPNVAPGLYAAADFENGFETSVQCGYLIWYKAPGAAGFMLTRIEQGSIDRAHLGSMTPAEREAVRAELRCPPSPSF